MKARWNASKQCLKSTLANARSVTVCLDGWSKQNLTATFLGVSVCFFDPITSVVRHLVLQLTELEHPHTVK